MTSRTAQEGRSTLHRHFKTGHCSHVTCSRPKPQKLWKRRSRDELGLPPLAGSPFPTGSNPISVKATPSGKFVYVTNYYANSITGFSLTGTNGILDRKSTR